MRAGAQLLLTLLFNASWQIALVTAFAALCDWLLRGTSPRYRHGLWVFVLLLGLAVPALSSAGVIKSWLSAKPKAESREIATAPVFVTRISSPDLDPPDLDSIEPPVANAPAKNISVEPVRRNLFSSPIHLRQNLAAVLLLLYGLFFLYRICQLIRAWLRTKKIVESAFVFESSASVETIIDRCRSAIGVRRVRLLASTLVPVPITVGIFRPTIILPERLLQDIDEEVLTTAIGHELVHVSRRDYLTNLVYELIYLPMSFHPAMALVRRRIHHTRELCCDEVVAAKLLGAETYARSLVRLIGSAPLGTRLAADTTIGLSQSDILEVRIMSLLKRETVTVRRKGLLLIAASLLLVAPSAAAAAFTLTLDIDRADSTIKGPESAMPATVDYQRDQMKRNREELERAVAELQAQRRVAPASQWPALDAQLREAQRDLAEYDRLRPDAELRLREAQQNLAEHERWLREREEKQKIEALHVTLAQLEKNRPLDASRLKDVREQIAEMEKLYTPEREREVQKSIAEMQKVEGDRKARLIYRAEPEYTEDAREKMIQGTVVLTLTVDHDGVPQNIQVKQSLYPSLDQSAIAAARKMRFSPAMTDGQPVSQTISVEFGFTVEKRSRQEIEAVEKRAAEDRAAQGDSPVLEMKRRKDREQQAREERARRQVELTRGAVITMDRAIQIAISQVPGKVLACSLGRDQDKLFYHVVIIGGDGEKSTATYVWVGAIDGQIIKTEKEDNVEEAAAKTTSAQISGGVLNGKATNLPAPEYPPIARSAHASGTVEVEVTIDETGRIIAAHAVSGHPLLQAAAVKAARQATFAPTRLNGEPVKVSGVLVYSFVAQ
jgi:TonB family protein